MGRQLIQNVPENLLWILVAANAEDSFQAFVPKGIAVGILRFCDSIGLGDQDIPNFELKCR